MAAEHRLPPNPAPGDECGREDRVDSAVRGAGGAGSVVGPPDLAEHLGLAQDLGIESGSDLEQVANGVLAIEAQQGVVDSRSAAHGEIAEPRLEIEVAGPVDLAAIAGGEKQCGAAGRGLALQPGRDFSRGEGEPLTHARSPAV